MTNDHDEKPARRGLGRGYYLAILGIAIFIGAVFYGTYAEVEGDPAGMLIGGAFWLMAICFLFATVLVAVDKGYHVVLGYALGLFAPLGLLIMTLLRDRRK